MKPLIPLLEARGTRADLLNFYEIEPETTFYQYDLVHFGYFAYALPFRESCLPPMTGNVHHIDLHRWKAVYEQLGVLDLRRIFVTDLPRLQELGMMGFTNVTLTKQAFDHSPFQPAPPPEGDFTVGVFGHGYFTKRFNIVEQACALTGVTYRPLILDESRTVYDEDPPTYYHSIHTLVSASLTDAGPMPPQEALLCGRPVIVTRCGSMPSVITEGYNGYFFDGSAKDLADKIRLLQRNYSKIQPNAALSRVPIPEDVVDDYHNVWVRIVEEEK